MADAPQTAATADEVELAIRQLLHGLGIDVGPAEADDRIIARLERIDGGPFFPTAFRIPRKTLFLMRLERRFAIALPRRAWDKSWKLRELGEYIADRTSKDHLNVRVAQDQMHRMDFMFGFFGVVAAIAAAAWWFAMPWTVWVFILPFLLGTGLVALVGVRHRLHYGRILSLRSGLRTKGTSQ